MEAELSDASLLVLDLSTNVFMVAVSGTLALARQCRALCTDYELPLLQAAWLVCVWLTASLLVGAQAS